MDNLAWAIIGLISAMTSVMVIQLHSRMSQLQRHVKLLLKHQGIDVANPPGVSDRVKELARDPSSKIAAIKLLREETGMGLAEAKTVVEDIARGTGA